MPGALLSFGKIQMELFVKGRVDQIDVFLVHPVLRQPQSLAEALEVDHLPGPQELDDIVDIRIVAQTQDVVVCRAGFLLCGDLVRTTLLPQSWEDFLYAGFFVIITLNLEVCQF